MLLQTKSTLSIFDYMLEDDGIFPNSDLPLLIYHHAFNSVYDAEIIKGSFAMNNWRNSWKNGIQSYHHYHSNTHEVLGIYDGTCEVIFGGDKGLQLSLHKGDVVIIPAGVAHKKLYATENFGCVGAYPGGKQYDMNTGRAGERPATDDNILKVELPLFDPVFGKNGPLQDYWGIFV